VGGGVLGEQKKPEILVAYVAMTHINISVTHIAICATKLYISVTHMVCMNSVEHIFLCAKVIFLWSTYFKMHHRINFYV
jgi:hypothetical protein